MLIYNIAWLLRRLFAVGGSDAYRIRPFHIDGLARLCLAAGSSAEAYTRDATGPERPAFYDLVRFIKDARAWYANGRSGGRERDRRAVVPIGMPHARKHQQRASPPTRMIGAEGRARVMIMATVQVGGVECSAADVTACLQVLEPQAKSHTTFAAIKNQLGTSDNPLAKADFWQVVNDWRATHPGVSLTTKVMLITALEDLLKTAEKRAAGPPVTTELAELIDQFRVEEDYPDGGRPQRDNERAELAPALSRDGLNDPDVQLLRRLAGTAYGYPGAQPGYYALLQSDDGVGAVAGTFRYLLYGPGDVADRLTDCIGGARKLPRVGEAMMVKALAVADPERWFPNHVTTGKVGKLAVLEALGEKLPADLAPGAAALASNDRIRQLLDQHFPDDPWGIQEFTWWLLHRQHVPDTPLKLLAEKLYHTEEFLAQALGLLGDKGQVVFYGPPGTGKTYVARELADYIARGGGTVEKVQFHPSYAYEDFIEGYRPRLIDGQVTYQVIDGPLKRIAATARERPDLTHILLIDELNRANVSKVFGELLFLLEYRDKEIQLQYSDAGFSLPANLQIIATMNTADRSIALVDIALRRRFHFVPFFPDKPPINSLLRRWLNDKQPELAWVADVVERANLKLANRNAFIGPSHFLKQQLTEGLVRLAWENSVLPFLEEYFFADPGQLERFALDRLRREAAQPLSHEAEAPGSPAEA